MPLKKKPKARKPTDIAVIDIGSNSVRLVIYRFTAKKDWPVYEKNATCGLAAGLKHASPRLSRKGMTRTLKTLRKFRRALLKRHPDRIYAIGTAAMRAVSHTRAGKQFHRRAEQALGCRIAVISGRKEARLTAYGVISSVPKAVGVCGDLGGGSLELATINRGHVGHTVTLALGSLTLVSESGGDPLTAERLMHKHLNHVAWLPHMKGGTFYPIGGSWRAVARVMMKKLGKPLQKVHGFTIRAAKAWRYAEDMAHQNPAAFRKMHKKISHRADVIPFAAAALAEIIMRMHPEWVTFSGHGVREGLVREKQLT